MPACRLEAGGIIMEDDKIKKSVAFPDNNMFWMNGEIYHNHGNSVKCISIKNSGVNVIIRFSDDSEIEVSGLPYIIERKPV
jgi:hypothetical protein